MECWIGPSMKRTGASANLVGWARRRFPNDIALGGGSMTKTVLAAAIGAIGMTTIAMAECRTMPFISYPAQNDSVSTNSTLTRGSACVHRFRSLNNLHYTSGSIASRPGHGTLTQTGMVEFRYTPQRGFKGVDRYSVRVCGQGGSGSGCSTITYNMTVE